MTEFRIVVNLSNFYQDFRAYSRVFVSSNIKTIHDLHDHIEDLFKLNRNFFLMCNNIYLPYDEDVRILKEDDPISICAFENNIFERKRKKAKRRANSENETEVLVDTSTLFSSKTECEDSQISRKIKKNKKAKLKETVLNEDVGYVESSENINKAEHKDEKPNKKQIKFSEQKRKVEPLPVSIIPRIIKPIVYNCGVPVVPQEDLQISESFPKLDTNKAMLNEPMDLEQVVSEEISQKAQNNREDLQENCCDLSKEEVQEVIADVKKKRHRVRHRKKKVKVMDHDIAEINRPIVMKTSTDVKPTHIKFNNDESKAVTVDDGQSPMNESSSVAIPPIENGNDLKETKLSSAVVTINDLSKEVSNFPLMSDIGPKVGDIIGFKTYVMSSCYTPEISDLIIGKVKRYSVPDKKVHFTLLEGGDQCLGPTGKFSMEDPDTIEIQDEFFWDQLMEPRLLFP